MQDDYQQILDYLSDELDAKEKASLETSLKEDERKQELFKQTVKNFHAVLWSAIWDSSDEDKAYARLHKRLHKHRLSLRVLRYAAVFILLLSGGVFFLNRQTPDAPLATSDADTGIRTEHKVPVLTLHDGKQLALHQSSLSQSEIQEKTNLRLTETGSLEYTSLPDTVKETVFHTLTVPQGCEFAVTLSDGSRIWLNAASELKYPETFHGNTREVHLSGEAYFEITADSNRPFYVHTQEMQLKVLGTSFNIKAYPDETETVTTLLTGSIEQHYPSSGQSLRLLPLQQVNFDHATGKLQTLKADPEETLAWKNGKFIARNKTLEEIFQQLSRWYGFETVYIHPELKQERFHLHTNRYATVREILDNLQSTNGIHFSYIDNKIYISH